MNNLLKNLYFSIMSAQFWQLNKLTIGMYKAIVILAGKLKSFYNSFSLRIYKLPRRSSNKYVLDFFEGLASSNDTSKNNKKRILKLARESANEKDWVQSQSYYQRLYFLTKSNIKDLEIFNEVKMNLSMLNRLLDAEGFTQQIQKYKKDIEEVPPKIAVVVAVSGNYDTIKLPVVLNSEIRYILYSDNPVIDTGVYEIRPLPYFHEDKSRMTRFVKTNLNQLLPEFELVLWVDANILILDGLAHFIDDFRSSRKAVGAIPHPLRVSVYEEVEACKARSKDNIAGLDQHAAHLKALGYDTGQLIESNFMLFNLRDERINKFFTLWWRELDSFSKRDQLSINYALTQSNIDFHPIMKRPENVRTHKSFSIISHKFHQSLHDDFQKEFYVKLVNPNLAESFSAHKKNTVERNKFRSIDVIYCVHNALEDVMQCLCSVEKHRCSQNFRLVIIDDGSGQVTAEYLQEFYNSNKGWVELHRNEAGSGYTVAANRGLKLSRADFVILLNSDTLVTEGWAEKLADAAFSLPSVGIVGPMSSAASHQSIPDHKSTVGQTAVNQLPENLTPDEINIYLESWALFNRYPVVPLVHGFCFCIRREVIDAIGYFDEENFPRGYGEENDYCFRAVDAGFRLALATNTYVYHAKSKSYDSEQRKGLMRKSNARLAELRGKERIRRAVITMQEHPELVRLREKCAALYREKEAEKSEPKSVSSVNLC